MLHWQILKFKTIRTFMLQNLFCRKKLREKLYFMFVRASCIQSNSSRSQTRFNNWYRIIIVSKCIVEFSIHEIPLNFRQINVNAFQIFMTLSGVLSMLLSKIGIKYEKSTSSKQEISRVELFYYFQWSKYLKCLLLRDFKLVSLI